MALIYSESPCVSAGTFTTNLVKAAPVKWDKNQVTSGASARAVVVNAGIANACTGAEGMEYCKDVSYTHLMTEKGITVMMATPDVDYASAWADEAAVFHEGRVLRQGPPCEVFADKKLLEETHLVQPAVMRLFNRLCQKNILDPSLPMPRSIGELEEYL